VHLKPRCNLPSIVKSRAYSSSVWSSVWLVPLALETIWSCWNGWYGVLRNACKRFGRCLGSIHHDDPFPKPYNTTNKCVYALIINLSNLINEKCLKPSLFEDFFFTSTTIIANHKLLSLSGSSIYHPLVFHFYSSKTLTLTHLILHPPTLSLNNTHFNTYSASSGNWTWAYPGLLFRQPLWFVVALLNKLVPHTWLLSGALEIWRLQLRNYDWTRITTHKQDPRHT